MSPLAVDLQRLDPGSDAAVTVIAHPESGSAIQADGYHGHVVLALRGAGSEYLVDPDLGLTARLQNGYAVGTEDGGSKFLYTARPDAREYLECDAWKRRSGAAQLLVDHLPGC